MRAKLIVGAFIPLLVFVLGVGNVIGDNEKDQTVPTQGCMQVILPEDVSDTEPVELPLKHTDVQAEIAGFVTRVKVVQTFSNPYDDPIEAVYVFPLPQKQFPRPPVKQ